MAVTRSPVNQTCRQRHFVIWLLKIQAWWLFILVHIHIQRLQSTPGLPVTVQLIWKLNKLDIHQTNPATYFNVNVQKKSFHGWMKTQLGSDILCVSLRLNLFVSDVAFRGFCQHCPLIHLTPVSSSLTLLFICFSSLKPETSRGLCSHSCVTAVCEQTAGLYAEANYLSQLRTVSQAPSTAPVSNKCWKYVPDRKDGHHWDGFGKYKLNADEQRLMDWSFPLGSWFHVPPPDKSVSQVKGRDSKVWTGEQAVRGFFKCPQYMNRSFKIQCILICAAATRQSKCFTCVSGVLAHLLRIFNPVC